MPLNRERGSHIGDSEVGDATASDAAVQVGLVQRPFLLNCDPHHGSGQLPS